MLPNAMRPTSAAVRRSRLAMSDNNNSRPVAGQQKARRELRARRRAEGNRNDDQLNVQRRRAQ